MMKSLRRKLFRLSCSLLMAALLLRCLASYGPALAAGAKTLAADPRSASFLFYLNTGTVLPPSQSESPAETIEETAPESAAETQAETAAAPETAQESPSVPESEPATEASSAPVGGFSAEEADALTVSGNCTLSYDKAALLLEELPLLNTADGPSVLIVHTHSTEAYTIEPGWEYAATEDCRTLDETHSVIRVGTELASRLEARGISVLHDKTINDYPSYAGAYDRMAAIIADYLARYPSIQMVLDVHRDAFQNQDGSAGTTARDGTAQVMLVVGTNEGGLDHPDWPQHLSLALKLDALLQREAPGVTRGISLCTQRYNQHLTEKSLLLEFGAAGDTLKEALAAADYVGDALGQLLAP